MMKKLFALLICFALFISPMRLYAASDEDNSYISVSYVPGRQKLIVEGREDISIASPVIIHLVSGSDAIASVENPPVVFDMVFAGENGSFASEFILPDTVTNGIYTVYVGNESRELAYTQNIIIYLEDSDDTREALESLNKSQDSRELESVITNDGMNLGIDVAELDNPSIFSKAVFGVKKSEGDFTLDEFAQAVSYAKGVVILVGKEDVAEVMRNYASAFDYSNAMYEALDKSVRIKADKILLDSDLYSGYVSYAETVMTAKAVLTKSYGELKTLLLENSSEYDIDIDGKYDSLSTNKKSEVFKVMFGKREGFKSVEDISEAFEKAVSSVSDKDNGGSSSGSDSRGHSGSSTVVGIDTAVSNETKLPYTDIGETFAKENIINLSNRGVISGYLDGTFKPQNPVTRAEFCKLVCVAFGFEGEGLKSFEDVSKNDWFYTYTGTLSELGIVNGDGVNFHPHDSITRQDAAVILCRALGVLNKITQGSYSFADDIDISEYAKESVATLASNGYFKGDGINFHPNVQITRAETAAVIDRIYTSVY